MRRRLDLIWIDGSAGAAVGIAMLLALPWLPGLYRMAEELVLLIGGANLAYGLYSLTLARRPERPLGLIHLLVAANATWAVLCVGWIVALAGTVSAFGIAHLAGEAAFVGGLAALEWRHRHRLRRRPDGAQAA